MPFFSGASPDLLQAAAWIFLFGFFVASRQLPLRVSFLIAAVKVALPLAYFAHDPSGTFHLQDDLGYFYDALRQIQTGPGDTWLFLTVQLPVIVKMMPSVHILYNLWNILSMMTFGPHYFAPVFFNVGLTFVAGFLFFRILREVGFSRNYARFALAFFLLNWDVLAWSSFLNLKDVLVMTLTLAALGSLLKFFRKPSSGPFLGMVVSLGMLFFLRFYAPLLIAVAVLLHLAFSGRIRWTLLAAGVVAAMVALKFSTVVRAFEFFEPLRVFSGVPRFVLTPQPWGLSAGYEFLFLPSILYLLLLPFAVAAIPSLWARNRASRFLFAYLAVVVVTYAVVPDLQGPRQRFQVSFMFIWMQFHALRAFARYAFRSSGDLAALDGDAAGLPEPGQNQA